MLSDRCAGWGCAGFANEGQFLAISAASLQDVNRRLRDTAAAKKREPMQVRPCPSTFTTSCTWMQSLFSHHLLRPPPCRHGLCALFCRKP